jgi:hypothetical protein
MNHSKLNRLRAASWLQAAKLFRTHCSKQGLSALNQTLKELACKHQLTIEEVDWATNNINRAGDLSFADEKHKAVPFAIEHCTELVLLAQRCGQISSSHASQEILDWLHLSFIKHGLQLPTSGTDQFVDWLAQQVTRIERGEISSARSSPAPETDDDLQFVGFFEKYLMSETDSSGDGKKIDERVTREHSRQFATFTEHLDEGELERFKKSFSWNESEDFYEGLLAGLAAACEAVESLPNQGEKPSVSELAASMKSMRAVLAKRLAVEPEYKAVAKKLAELLEVFLPFKIWCEDLMAKRGGKTDERQIFRAQDLMIDKLSLALQSCVEEDGWATEEIAEMIYCLREAIQKVDPDVYQDSDEFEGLNDDDESEEDGDEGSDDGQ